MKKNKDSFLKSKFYLKINNKYKTPEALEKYYFVIKQRFLTVTFILCFSGIAESLYILLKEIISLIMISSKYRINEYIFNVIFDKLFLFSTPIFLSLILFYIYNLINNRLENMKAMILMLSDYN